ncbi:hypothetical protein D3C77_638780 [compost metagenome]
MTYFIPASVVKTSRYSRSTLRMILSSYFMSALPTAKYSAGILSPWDINSATRSMVKPPLISHALSGLVSGY